MQGTAHLTSTSVPLAACLSSFQISLLLARNIACGIGKSDFICVRQEKHMTDIDITVCFGKVKILSSDGNDRTNGLDIFSLIGRECYTVQQFEI